MTRRCIHKRWNPKEPCTLGYNFHSVLAKSLSDLYAHKMVDEIQEKVEFNCLRNFPNRDIPHEICHRYFYYTLLEQGNV